MTEELETLGRVAEATGAVAKATGKALDILSDAGGFFNRLMGGPVADSVGLLADRLRFFRVEQAVLLAKRTEQRLAEKGVTNIRLVPPKVALPLIEEATLETDPDLGARWANLLAAAIARVK